MSTDEVLSEACTADAELPDMTLTETSLSSEAELADTVDTHDYPSAVDPVTSEPQVTTTDVVSIADATKVQSSEEPTATPKPLQTDSVIAAGTRTVSKSKKKKVLPPVNVTSSGGSQPGSQGNPGENTGRWTAEEHRLFLQGLEQHGKGWKKIASLIKSRTVVQIRTHAQKYFQKLAKARQNGEEGEVTMEGRGGAASVASSSSSSAAAQNNKRRRQTTGTKRKAIHSVVTSALKQAKKVSAKKEDGELSHVVPLPVISPALAHFVVPNARSTTGGDKKNTSSCVPSITTTQGTISGPALEDSLFRFLTPAAPACSMELQVNDVARQAGANPIVLPTDNPSSSPTPTGGEVSPTGVLDLAIYPSWTDAKDTPSWYAKGADVDALLDVASGLDWFCDTGDLQETFQPPPIESSMGDFSQVETSKVIGDFGHSSSVNSTSVCTLPHVDSNVESVVPPLPSLFDGSGESNPNLVSSHESVHLCNEADIDVHLQVFDSPIEEHDFVSTILENSNDSTDSFPVLG